jgi:hypothetical protein
MSLPATLPQAILDTILSRLALLFLSGAGDNMAVARDAVRQLLADYNPETAHELNLAAEIISLQMHALDALSYAASPDMARTKSYASEAAPSASAGNNTRPTANWIRSRKSAAPASSRKSPNPCQPIPRSKKPSPSSKPNVPRHQPRPPPNFPPYTPSTNRKPLGSSPRT